LAKFTVTRSTLLQVPCQLHRWHYRCPYPAGAAKMGAAPKWNILPLYQCIKPAGEGRICKRLCCRLPFLSFLIDGLHSSRLMVVARGPLSPSLSFRKASYMAT
jgi:hypothetical protein